MRTTNDDRLKSYVRALSRHRYSNIAEVWASSLKTQLAVKENVKLGSLYDSIYRFIAHVYFFSELFCKLKLQLLGQGAYGTVKLGRWRGRNVAVKQSNCPKNDSILKSEIETVSHLNHPNIVKVYYFSLEPPLLLVMECADQGSLYDVLYHSDIVYSNETAISWLLQCAQGIDYMHAQKPKPIVHCDLKSSNLLLFNGGRIKICDFGAAREAKHVMSKAIGTPNYMAPEVFRSRSYTEKCDVYSWAIIIWEVLARKVPFGEIKGARRLMKAVTHGARPPRLRNCSMAIDALMIRCWQQDTSLRPAISEAEAEMRAIVSSSKPLFLQMSSVGVNQQVVLDNVDGSTTELSSQADYLEFEELTVEHDMLRNKMARRQISRRFGSTQERKLEHTIDNSTIRREISHTRFNPTAWVPVGSRETSDECHPSGTLGRNHSSGTVSGHLQARFQSGELDMLTESPRASAMSAASLNEKNMVCAEVSVDQITFKEFLGQGSFGVVRKAHWRGRDVAVKLTNGKEDGQSLRSEIHSLCRLDHPKIVKVYGFSTRDPVLLVMEYAELGSLYNVVHCSDRTYSNATAISWLIQCAQGINYLHSQQPEPMVHRDLKSPNLLLFDGGRLIKICDFGTARDVRTEMTNNTGTWTWMAPEVFTSTSYTDRCDVYSWAIVLWEVLAREKPFAGFSNKAAVMYAVSHGTRPPSLSNCPPALESLMARCWLDDPSLRPSIAEVEAEMMVIVQPKMAAFLQLSSIGVHQEIGPHDWPDELEQVSKLDSFRRNSETELLRNLAKELDKDGDRDEHIDQDTDWDDLEQEINVGQHLQRAEHHQRLEAKENGDWVLVDAGLQVDSRVVADLAADQITYVGHLGQGAYGVVKMGRWRGHNVAVKQSDGHTDDRSLQSEIQTLSQLDHPNIVKIYAVSTRIPILLVMECADQGSLYDGKQN
ncbi:Mitogen-activated protein kinase kinase kinase 7 [Halotydeus destructor]|nr:Mitogen-activated protein kinase kinase kinase 7 [Halotydeus destructor]